MAPHNNTNNNDSLFHTVPSAATAAASDEDSPLWSISVKTVGAEQQRTNDNGTVIPSSFQIKVQPNEDIGSLQDRIETMTGLKPHQQRLIYRGRLILPNPQEEEQQQEDDTTAVRNNTRKPTKISEIKGLSDGQTIHLVRRPASTPSSPSSNNNNNTQTPPRTSNNNTATTTDDSFPSSPGTSSLLAALLGLSALEEEAASEDAPSPTTTPQRWRRYGRRNRNPYRLTAQDLQVPDPGSMESVRQGLLTLHTLLPLSMSATQNPLDVPRQWYLGQWIDCRDTVNQWLEATIVDMVRPEDVLPASFLARERQTNNSATQATVPAMDPAVAASDMEGRRRLLLEPSDDNDDDDEENDLEHLCELHGWQRRAGDHDRNVVLLLIHYNGWPHRWDEWIRSDSERIRPFRVRTRHATHGPHTSPTTQSQYTDSPSTTFLPTGQEDRSVLLHELVRVTGQVHTLAQAAAQGVPAVATPVETSDTVEPTVAESRRRAELLPWIDRDNEGTAVAATQDEADTATLDPNHSLATLAPLLDRLGRTLVDAAPHVASLAAAAADSTPNRVNVPHAELVGALTEEEEEEEEEAQEENDNEPAAAREETEATSSPNNNNRDNPNSLGGLLSMLNGERRRNSRTSQVTDQALTHVSSGDGTSVAASTTPAIDPDYMDFATGLVNVSRGDVRSGPRGARHGRTSSAADDIGGLLGAYLAAASLGGLGSTGGATLTTGDTTNNNNNNTTNDLQGLGQLLRNRGTGDAGGGTGGGGGGIDIHIHAVVTAPGGGGGGTGTTAAILAGGGGGTGLGALAMAGGGGTAGDTTTASSPDLFANTRRAAAQRVRATLLEQNEEDAGIFDDLYSENPDPVSPTSSADDTANNNNNEGANSHRETGSTQAESTHRASPPRRGSRRRDNSSSNNNSTSNNRSSSFLGRLFRRGGGTD